MLGEAGASHTDWMLIEEAGREEGPSSAVALERVVRRYWPAVYAYVRSTGRDVHAASDLTQGFIADIVIGRRLCAGADRRRGRFRALLLVSVRNYLRERHRHDTRKVRRGGSVIPLDVGEVEAAASQRSPQPSPEGAFDYQWSATLVRRVLEIVRGGCEADELGAHWAVFEQRVVRPMLLGEPPTDYGELVERLGLNDAAQAANMMVTVKRRFARALREEVAGTVGNADEIEDELRDLLEALERPA
jgi:RNA polymerase sigma-70 factor (ECF subfamily)